MNAENLTGRVHALEAEVTQLREMITDLRKRMDQAEIADCVSPHMRIGP